ncbi:hypothetical protein CMI37_14805 [Candidatus Pacearchaeota archaeon]|nr:hypothetical protein [Candidatus Pacearchaeota archaeon]
MDHKAHRAKPVHKEQQHHVDQAQKYNGEILLQVQWLAMQIITFMKVALIDPTVKPGLVPLWILHPIMDICGGIRKQFLLR